jgi:hypothetical protein
LTVAFATPIAHQTVANYAAFNNALVLGRPFRQPLLTGPNPADFSHGLELILSSAGVVADIYGWLDSTLTWVPASAAAPGDRLVLTVDPHVLSMPGSDTSLSSVPTLERKPRRAVYENVDRAAVQTALEMILIAAHAHANANPLVPSIWHPSMRMMVIAVPAGPHALKDYLDAHAPVNATVTRLVTDLLNADPAAVLREIRVQAGDRLGRAAPYLSTDPLPAAPPFPLGAAGDPDRARRLTFVTEGSAGGELDPLYYMHVLMRQMLLPAAQRVVITQTNTVQGGNLVHPLVTLLPALNNATVPKARAQVNGTYWFPIGGLADWHGSPRPPAATVSTAEWRYTRHALYGLFEARVRATGDPIALTVRDEHRKKVGDFWTDAALVALTNLICAELQIPTELVVALACTESLANLSPRSIRFEPLLDGDRARLRSSPAATHELEYDKLVGLRATVTAATYNPGDTTQLAVTFVANRTLAVNRLAILRFKLLVGDADRLVITANTGSAAPVANYDITVRDARSSGGSAVAGTQAPGQARFYSMSARGAGNVAAGPVEIAVARAGRLRRMRTTLGQNTLAGPTTVTVMRNGAPTAIAVTLAAGARVGVDNAHTEDLASGDRIALRVETSAGGAGQIRNISCDIQFAPANAGDVYTLEGYSPPAPGVPNPYVGAALVRAAASTLTWAQMEAVVDGTEGRRVSPGMLQTLISTAVGAAKYLEKIDPGIFARLGIPAPPATPSRYMIDWLLTAGHSVLVGAAYLRQAYATNDTRFDLPYVGAAYNGGNTNTAANTRWGFQNREWNYPDHAAPYFNAAVFLFDGDPAPATPPSVRFMS